MHRIAFRVLPVLLALAASPALGADAPKSQDPHAAFAETDKNGDGRIDREEFHERVVEIFYFGDTDKDGFLTHEELVKAVAFPEDFKDADRDGDGRISLYEFIQVRFATFDKVDKNHDGVLSMEEVVATYESKR